MGNNIQEYEEAYEVEKIVAKRIRKGNVEYKLHWKDYDASEDSWETIDNCHCIDLIKKFEEFNKKKANRGRKKKISSQDKAGEQFIPIVAKERYHFEEKIEITDVLGLTSLEVEGTKMALVRYSDEYAEYVPVDKLRENEKAKELLLDLFINQVRIQKR